MLLLSLLACTATPDPIVEEVPAGATTSVTLVYTARMDGELEPCG